MYKVLMVEQYYSNLIIKSNEKIRLLLEKKGRLGHTAAGSAIAYCTHFMGLKL